MNNRKAPYAEDVNYWKSGQSSPDSWIDKAKAEIKAIGGTVTDDAFVNSAGKASYLMAFKIGGDQFRLQWPVLQSRTNNERAARIQAATMVYHDVKARVMAEKILGARAAFMPFLVLPDGRNAAEAVAPELALLFPTVILLPAGKG